MTTEATVDVELLRAEIEKTYTEVSTQPTQDFIFPTGRAWAEQLGYPQPELARVPDQTVASFAGVANPFSLGRIEARASVLDLGCGAGTDLLIAAQMVGAEGEVIGIDMTPEMLGKSRRNAEELGAAHVSFREGLAEAIPIDDAWADAVISNGVINLCADKQAVFAEIHRILRPGGVLQFADIANGRPVPLEALRDIDLWTG